MAKLKSFFVDKAQYFSEDENGRKIILNIDYWNGTYTLSRKNAKVEDFAKKLLRSKHRVNFVSKLVQ
jgi:hypothetical protein